MNKSFKLKNLLLIACAALVFTACSSKDDEEYALANFYLDEYIKRFGVSKDIDYARYLKIKANFLGFKYQFRDQQLIEDTLAQIEDFKAKYKNSPYMPLVDTINSRMFMAKASMDKEIADLYTRRDKELGTAFYMDKVKKSWVNPEEIQPVKVPWYRALFE